MNTLEDTDLDTLMADLIADISEVEKTTLQEPRDTSYNEQGAIMQPPAKATPTCGTQSVLSNIPPHVENEIPAPPAEIPMPPPPPPAIPLQPLTQVSNQRIPEEVLILIFSKYWHTDMR